MSSTIAQIYIANPITTIGNTDLIYFGQGGTTDAAMIGSVFKALFVSPLTASGTNSAYGGATSTATGSNSITYGSGCTNAGDECAVFGINNTISAASTGTLMCGSGNDTGGNGVSYSICIGNSNSVTANYGYIFGQGCSTSSSIAFVWGSGSSAAHQACALGVSCHAAANTFALGKNATANSAGSFVLNDGNNAGVQDTAGNQYVATFTGGHYLYVGASLSFSLDTAGNVINSLGMADLSKTILTPLTGDTVTLVTTNFRTILNPAGTLATLTIDMPAAPVNGQLQRVTSTQIVTALTVSGNGNSIIGEPTSLAVGSTFTMIYDTATTTWYPG